MAESACRCAKRADLEVAESACRFGIRVALPPEARSVTAQLPRPELRAWLAIRAHLVAVPLAAAAWPSAVEGEGCLAPPELEPGAPAAVAQPVQEVVRSPEPDVPDPLKKSFASAPRARPLLARLRHRGRLFPQAQLWPARLPLRVLAPPAA